MATTAFATSVGTAAALTATATAAARSLQRVIELLEFRLCSRTSLNNATHKLQIATCERMVEVHNNLQWGNLLYGSEDGRTVGTHHLNDIACIDMCRIELAVDSKYLAVKILYVVGVVIAVSIGRRYCKIERITLFKILEILLKRIKSITDACKESKRLLTCCLLYLFALTVTV